MRGLNKIRAYCFFLVIALASVFSVHSVAWADSSKVVVGSKAFAEGYLLGEIVAQKLERDGFDVERKLGLGKTIITYEALLAGEIDVYVEYTGTLYQAILKRQYHPQIDDEVADINQALKETPLKVLPSLGFNNTYALVMDKKLMEEKTIKSISDLKQYPDLVLSLSHEFIDRTDGWQRLKSEYDLPFSVSGIEHSLAYQAIQSGKIDLTDAYSTDGDINRFGLQLLEDDLFYFPSYRALPFIRKIMPVDAQTSLAELAGLIDEAKMQELNALALEDDHSYAEVATDFLNASFGTLNEAETPYPWKRLMGYVYEHLWLTFTALISATFVGVLVAILAYRSSKLSRVLIYSTGLMQTIPSLALLALLIPIFGIGWVPAVIALFIYSLLPIVRSTINALVTIDSTLVEVAQGLGLTKRQQLRTIYLPMALPGMLTGIKTAAIISIGTATLASFIGAGGLGDPIITGLSLNDHEMVLMGAIPAAILAILMELLFEYFETRWIPAHMRSNVT